MVVNSGGGGIALDDGRPGAFRVLYLSRDSTGRVFAFFYRPWQNTT